MKKAKRLLFILLALSLILTITACVCAESDHTDTDSDGKCDKCGTKINIECEHEDIDTDGKCDKCSEVIGSCTHADTDADTKCDKCGADVGAPPCEHTDANTDGKCDKCATVVGECTHADTNTDGKCDKCATVVGECTHADTNTDGKCDKCATVVGECIHADTNDDRKCDKCEKIFSEDGVILFNNGTPTFQFVLANDLSVRAKALIMQYVNGMDYINVDIDVAEDTANTIKKREVLIGNVTSRGTEYECKRHTLGKGGYAFKIVDSKVVVNAGSDEALLGAIETFIKDVLKYDESVDIMGTLYMEPQQEIEKKQFDYTVALKVNGNEMTGYTIATDTSNNEYKNAAIHLQEAIYEEIGYWFEIVDIDDADKSIIIQSIDKVIGEDSFNVYTNINNQLVIDCAFDNMLDNAISAFIAHKIASAKSDVNFTSSVYKQDISFLTYEAFGAKGDGRTDDFEAIYATHVAANNGGQPVKAKSGATYYIRNNSIEGRATAVPIKTNTDWTGASFIIDDSDLDFFNSKDQPLSQANIFEVISDYDVIKITDKAVLDAVLAAGLNRSTTKVDLGLGYPAMIVPYNDDHMVYRRKGYAGFKGNSMHEVIVIDKDGNIDLTSESKTPVMFDYNHLDRIEVYRTDIEPVTITGGTFTSLGNRVDAKYTVYENNELVEKTAGYFRRGLNIERSFTTVDGLIHYIENEFTPKEYAEGKESAPYSGFFYAKNATNVTFKNCTLTGRRYYSVQGTYDFGANAVNKIVLDNCHQSNFWVTYDSYADKLSPAKRDDPGAMTSMSTITAGGKAGKLHWGIGGTNFCKNMEYLNSTLSRFDAHSGLYNGKVINSTVNYLALTGNGDFIIENVDWYSEGASSANSTSIFHLRADYGSTWEGDIKVKDLRAYIFVENSTPYLFLHTYSNWYYGYIAHMPNLVLDNLDLYNIKTFQPVPAGHTIHMIQNSVRAEPAMHLDTTRNTPPVYPYLDNNEDGYVDEINVRYDPDEVKNNWDGIRGTGNKNLNIVAPPDYIKILNNDGVDTNNDGVGEGGYIIHVPKTYNESFGIPDINGRENEGFFGSTKFYYGPGENDYYHGTNYTDTEIFIFQ